MFGYFKPPDRATRRAMFRAQCGLCQRFGSDFRLRTRALAGHDASMLLLLCDGLAPTAAPRVTVRCPIPLAPNRRAIAPEWPASKAVAMLQLFLLGEKLRDDHHDDRSLASRMAQRVFAREIGISHTWLESAGFPLTGARALLERQRRDEADAAADLETLVKPSAELLALVFAFAYAQVDGADDDTSHAPVTPGGDTRRNAKETLGGGRGLTRAGAEGTQPPGPLWAFGAALGRLLYLVDALDDWIDDGRKGRFNPIAHSVGPVTPRAFWFLQGCFAAWSVALQQAFQALPLRRHHQPLSTSVTAFIATGERLLAQLPRQAGLSIAGANRAHATDTTHTATITKGTQHEHG